MVLAFEAVFTGMSARLQEGNLKFHGLFCTGFWAALFAPVRKACGFAQICGFAMPAQAA
ncbi:hypothetical protein TH47_01430 [Thalassospira sp. MCCC 1A02803]|nr:hypothetical protein TH47_01430 [Thalassospira sp. MCCC 1A02803]